MIKNLIEYLDIFWTFIKIGATVFGGGYAMIPVIERELINKKKWLDMTEVMEYYTIAQITPGIIMVNVATFVGCKRKGVLGGILATLGVITPGVLLMVVVSVFIKRFAEYEEVRHAFTGIRVAVCALILSTVIKLIKDGLKKTSAIVIFICVLVLSAVFSASPALLILGAGAAGFLLYRPAKKKPENDEESAK